MLNSVVHIKETAALLKSVAEDLKVEDRPIIPKEPKDVKRKNDGPDTPDLFSPCK